MIKWLSEDPDGWNTVKLGKHVLPGICTVSLDLEERIDIKKPDGTHGATVTRKGVDPASVIIQLKMWQREQIAALQKMLPDLRPDPRRDTGSHLPIVHPKTALWGIPAVLIRKIKDPPNEEGGKFYILTFDCIEFLPPQTKSGLKTETKLDPRKQNLAADLVNKPSKPSKTNTGA